MCTSSSSVVRIVVAVCDQLCPWSAGSFIVVPLVVIDIYMFEDPHLQFHQNFLFFYVFGTFPSIFSEAVRDYIFLCSAITAELHHISI